MKDGKGEPEKAGAGNEAEDLDLKSQAVGFEIHSGDQILAEVLPLRWPKGWVARFSK